MSEVTVEMSGAGKRFGDRWALRDVTLTIPSGEILGFIGPNGAGKTTLIRLLAGLARPSEGAVHVLGRDLSRGGVTPAGVGLVTESPQFIPYLSGRRNVEYLAAIRGQATAHDVATVLERVGLDPADGRATRKYSLGMRQRLGLAQALVERPRLLLLDEPTNGLDPSGIVELRAILREVAAQGATVFMASHLLTEVEQLCHRVILVRDGRIVREFDRDRDATGSAVRLVLAGPEDLEALHVWARVRGITPEADGGESAVVLTPPGSTPDLVRDLVRADIGIEEVTPMRRSLEAEFLDSEGGI